MEAMTSSRGEPHGGAIDSRMVGRWSGGLGSAKVTVGPADGSYLVQAQFVVATDADRLAVERAINSSTR